MWRPEPVGQSVGRDTPSAASPSGETDTADLVTEEVEPGVERIRSDGAGHDLEERHPNFATTWTTST